MKSAAGILLYRHTDRGLEVLLVHPSGNYNRKAMEAYRSGNVNMARHWCNTSLGLNKNQPEMILLRQEITGKKRRAFERSIIETTFRGELGPLPKERADLPREINGYVDG